MPIQQVPYSNVQSIGKVLICHHLHCSKTYLRFREHIAKETLSLLLS